MCPFSLVGEERNLPRFLLPSLSGKEKRKGKKTEDVIKNENDTDEEVPKMSRDPAGVRRVSGFLLSDKFGRAVAATLRTPRAPSSLGRKYESE